MILVCSLGVVLNRVFLFARSGPQLPKIRTQDRTRWSVPSQSSRTGFGFLGSEWNNSPVGQEIPSCPGRMSTLREQETGASSSRALIHTAYSSSQNRAAWRLGCLTPPSYLPINARPPRKPAKSCGHMRRRAGRVQLQYR